MRSTFHYYLDNTPVEDVERYKPGGYHPVKLGDFFSTLPASVALDPGSGSTEISRSTSPRYRILHKLGYGSFSTVWLARDMLPPCSFVALKIMVADLLDADRETRILKLLGDTSTVDREGSQHILTLKDSFQIEGPNGTHHVLVTEVLASLDELICHGIYRKFRMRVIQEAFMGISYLHSRGVAHGDLHIGNFGCSIPRLDEEAQSDIMEFFDPAECVPVIPVDPAKQTASLPPYVVESVSMANYMVKSMRIKAHQPSLKIIDFGSAYRQGEIRPPPCTAFSIRSPEMVFPMIALGQKDPEWDVRSDVWSLACTIYEIFAGCAMFGGGDGMLFAMAQLTGQLPAQWASWWASTEDLNDKDISAARSKAEWMDHRPIFEDRGTVQQADRFLSLLQTMMVLDPAERPSIRQVMETHSWLETNNDS